MTDQLENQVNEQKPSKQRIGLGATLFGVSVGLVMALVTGVGYSIGKRSGEFDKSPEAVREIYPNQLKVVTRDGTSYVLNCDRWNQELDCDTYNIRARRSAR